MPPPERLVYITAGAAGMYCGSCMHDNALARSLISQGVDTLLVPVYTPIRTDEVDVSQTRVFFGGINVFLQQRLPLLGYLPPRLRRLLDAPGLLRWATRGTRSTDPASLGALTVSMLKGRDGRQWAEVDRLCRWLSSEVNPSAVILSNLLIGGCIPELKKRLGVPVIVILQGDDLFLDFLPEESRRPAIAEMRKLAAMADALVVNSRFYGQKMGALLGIPEERMRLFPLTIDLDDGSLGDASAAPPMLLREGDGARIGYLARIAPEKGLHRLADAFIELASRPGCDSVELHAAGWLGENHHGYLARIRKQLEEAGLAERFVYHGSPDHRGKRAFLESIDLLCVPTEYEEPKGLFVLEALAAGVPVVQPAHGAFPEMLEDLGGGILCAPLDSSALADALHTLATDAERRRALGQAGREAVHRGRHIRVTARQLSELVAELRTQAPVHAEERVSAGATRT